MAQADFDIDRLADYLHMLPAAVIKLAERGKLPARRVGGEWRFSAAEIHHWLEDRIGLSDDEALVKMEGALDRAADADAEAVSIAELLRVEAIEAPLDARTRGSVILKMTELASRTHLLWDPAKMAEAVRAREEMHSTALDNGVALLHPRRPMPAILAEAVLALGISRGRNSVWRRWETYRYLLLDLLHERPRTLADPGAAQPRDQRPRVFGAARAGRKCRRGAPDHCRARGGDSRRMSEIGMRPRMHILPPAVQLVGDWHHADFCDALELLHAGARVVTSVGDGPELIVVAQSRPGSVDGRAVECLRKNAPLAAIVALVGSWCEGELRTGRPWPGVERVYWYDFPPWWQRQIALRAAELCPEWARVGDTRLRISDCGLRIESRVTGSFVVIRSGSRGSAESIADVLQAPVMRPRGSGCEAVRDRGARRGNMGGRPAWTIARAEDLGDSVGGSRPIVRR